MAARQDGFNLAQGLSTPNLSRSFTSNTLMLEDSKYYHVQAYYSASLEGSGSFYIQSSVISGTWSVLTSTSQSVALAGTGTLSYEIGPVAYPYARLVYTPNATLPPTGSLVIYGHIKK
jgi:hypothetical protein